MPSLLDGDVATLPLSWLGSGVWDVLTVMVDGLLREPVSLSSPRTMDCLGSCRRMQ